MCLPSWNLLIKTVAKCTAVRRLQYQVCAEVRSLSLHWNDVVYIAHILAQPQFEQFQVFVGAKTASLGRY